MSDVFEWFLTCTN